MKRHDWTNSSDFVTISVFIDIVVVDIAVLIPVISWGDYPLTESQISLQKITQNKKNQNKYIKFTTRYVTPLPGTRSLESTRGYCMC